MADDRTEQASFKPMTLALAGLGVLSVWTALLPEADRPWNFAALGAVTLFSFARLPLGQSISIMLLAIGFKDLCIYLTFGWPPEPLTYVAYLGYAAVGRFLLRSTESPLAVVPGAVAGSLVFFLISNFGSWLMQSMPYGYSLAGLLDCYEAGIPFYRGTLSSDVIAGGTIFMAHRLLSHAYFPAERVALQTERAE